MKQHPEQLSIYDIVLDHDNIPKVVTEVVCKTDGLKKPEKEYTDKCPYHIPIIAEIIKKIDDSGYKVNKSKLISDVFECGAIAISNRIDFTMYDEREEKYRQIIKSYAPQERKVIAEIFGMIFALLSSVVYKDGAFNDYLGELFMKCNQGNKKSGQFFTPYHISELMARMTITDESIKEGEIITIGDPCCGSGGLILATMDVLQNEYNVNYARDCFVECADIDIRCVHMTYLQLSLAGVPAIIKHQDTLTQELWSIWKTPAYIFQYGRFCRFEK